ncbi:MAG: DUF4856 domain-containing protein [Niabella sp.]
MKFITGIICCFTVLLFSCVKNEELISAYTVPATYSYTNSDSSAKASVIMMCAMQNYLNTSVSTTISQAVVDSLWNNDSEPFTSQMVTNFLYVDTILNNMTSVYLSSLTSNADSIKAFADSAVDNSVYYNVAGSEGVTGWQTQSDNASTKRLFNAEGKEYSEIWYQAMLGAMAMYNTFNELTGTATYWNMAYDYIGLPQNYDPTYDYTATPVPADRPLGIAALFADAGKTINAGYLVDKELRTGRAAIDAGDSRVYNIAIDTITIVIEKTVALAAVSAFNSAIESTDIASKLHYLSQAYGLVIALNNRSTSYLTSTNYWLLREIMDGDFYTLIADSAAEDITEARDIIADAYGL